MLAGGEAGLEEKPLKVLKDKIEKMQSNQPSEAPDDLQAP
jgi:hypothetical protein